MKIKSKNAFYALFCSDAVYSKKKDYLICGVFSTRKEAEDCAAEIKDCPLKHFIRKVNVMVEFPVK